VYKKPSVKVFICILFLLFGFSVTAQNTTVVTNLSSSLSETSGLIELNGKLITHNDSGGEVALFEIDTLTGSYTRKVIIENATNVDWEDITADNNYIYIGDIGNNNGNRTNLRIYRVAIADYQAALNDTVQADIIDYNYADQVDFIDAQYSTNYDAEAMITYNDTVYLFTKNWGNQKSYVYAIPNTIGAHSVTRIDSLNPQGLITGATYDSITQKLLLCGYQTTPFIYETASVLPPYFSSVSYQKSTLNLQNFIQIEGVTSIGSQYYLSAEQNPLGAASLYRLNHSGGLGVDEINDLHMKVYPNPIVDWLVVEMDGESFSISIYNIMGELVLTSKDGLLDCSGLKMGSYFIQIIRKGESSVFYNGTVVKL
jgi:hypothetical protein